MKKNLIIILVLWQAQFLFAQTGRHYSNEFLNIGVDARALAMGNAVTASINDGTAGYWNPAGLSGLNHKQVSLMHAAYFANIAQYDYMSYAKPVNNNTAMSISLIRFGVDNIMNTTLLIDNQGNINYDRITYFSAADYALSFSLGRKNVWKGLSLGATAKLVYRHIGKFASGYGFGFDVGAQYQVKKWQFGLMFRDITTTFNYWHINQDEYDKINEAIPRQNTETPDKIELTLPKLQMGMARKFRLNNKINMLTSLDLQARFYKMNTLVSSDAISIDPALGFEFDYSKIAFLRLGVNNFREEQYFDDNYVKFQPNAGLGFAYKGVRVDYALTNIGTSGFYSHIFSLQFDLDRLFPNNK